jgi:hypothetical protein
MHETFVQWQYEMSTRKVVQNYKEMTKQGDLV